MKLVIQFTGSDGIRRTSKALPELKARELLAKVRREYPEAVIINPAVIGFTQWAAGR